MKINNQPSFGAAFKIDNTDKFKGYNNTNILKDYITASEIANIGEIFTQKVNNGQTILIMTPPESNKYLNEFTKLEDKDINIRQFESVEKKFNDGYLKFATPFGEEQIAALKKYTKKILNVK